MKIFQIYMLKTELLLITVNYFLYVRNNICMSELENHTSLVNLSDIQKLIHKLQNPFAITVHGLVIALPDRIIIDSHKLLERSNQKRQRILQFVRDIREKFKFGLVDLLLVLVLSDLLLGKIVLSLPQTKESHKERRQYGVNNFSSSAGPYRWMHDNCKIHRLRCQSAIKCPELQIMLSSGQTTERQTLRTSRKRNPHAAVNAVFILQPRRSSMLDSREQQGESIVPVRKLNFLRFIYRTIQNSVSSGFHSASHGFITDIHSGNPYFPLFGRIHYLQRIEPCQSVQSAKPQSAIRIFPGHITIRFTHSYSVFFPKRRYEHEILVKFGNPRR